MADKTQMQKKAEQLRQEAVSLVSRADMLNKVAAQLEKVKEDNWGKELIDYLDRHLPTRPGGY